VAPPALTTLAPRPSACQAAEEALRRAILSGGLPAGSRLPPERALCARLGISRLTLRAALAALATAGLLDIRHGSGTVVRDFRHTGGPDLVTGLIALAGDRRRLRAIAADLLRIRRHLAGAVLESLVERPPSAAAVRAVAAAVDGFARAARDPGDSQALARADLEVVQALVAATRSEVLALSLNPIAAILAGTPELLAALFATPAENLAGWKLLLSWLRRPRAGDIAQLVAVLAERDRATLARLTRRS
jgi:GntR family transcriptional regulator, transcriptional repressor for pyruvate dehydrogenase complex